MQAYRLSPQKAWLMVESLEKSGFRNEDIIMDESAPDHKVVLQAEVVQSERYLDMRYALCSGVGMRQAYEQMTHANGLRAKAILEQHLDASSCDTLNELLEAYSGYVIELSSYSCVVGVYSHNTLFWEVRNW